jgi:hypothetical protein
MIPRTLPPANILFVTSEELLPRSLGEQLGESPLRSSLSECFHLRIVDINAVQLCAEVFMYFTTVPKKWLYYFVVNNERTNYSQLLLITKKYNPK